MDRLERGLDERVEARRGGQTQEDAARLAAVLLEMLFRVQRQVCLDLAKRIAALTPRRSGKTTTVRARLVRCCLLKPGANCLYLALTRPSAKKLMWGGKAGLKRINTVLGLGARFNNSTLVMTFPNGSSITLAGASTYDEIDKLRGDEYDEVWVDECKSFPADLFEELLEEVIEPALITRNGVLGLIGTPGNLLNGPFYDITRVNSDKAKAFTDEEAPDDEGGLYSFHTWQMRDNTAEPEQWARALRLKAAKGWSDRHPVWRREYLGQWAADDTGYVYRFRAHSDDGKPWNTWTPAVTKANPLGLPEGHAWEFVFGLDFGWSDDFALVVLAFSNTHRDVLQVHEYAEKKLTPSQIGDYLQKLIARIGHPIAMVADNAGLGGGYLAELAERFGLAIEAAEKRQKLDNIELTNGDLIDGRLKLLTKEHGGGKTIEQMVHLQWDEKGPPYEDKKQANHCCDALIYARRRSLHHHAGEPALPRPAPGTPEAIDLKAYEEELRVAKDDDDDLPQTMRPRGTMRPGRSFFGGR